MKKQKRLTTPTEAQFMSLSSPLHKRGIVSHENGYFAHSYQNRQEQMP